MGDRAIECGNPLVADLVNFVAARAEEERSGTHGPRPPGHPRTEMLDIVENFLLSMARETCRSDEPCALPDHCLRTLGEYAAFHRSHPDFHPGWLRWRLLA